MSAVARLPGVRRLPPLASRVRPDVILFHSWWGRVGDSPRAIADELRRRGAPFEHVWVCGPGATAPDEASAVAPGSLAYLRATGRAHHLVSNNTLPGYFRKKRATHYLQTWHGTPLKRIGFDIERPSFPDSERYLRNLRREVQSWDALISPNRFSTDVLRGAFGYDGEVIESGYPRNDVLVGDGVAAVRARVREELGIGDGTRAVLYAPTWRDTGSFATELDLPALAAALGDDHVVLVRAHSAVASTLALPESPALRDVSGHDDVAELLLAADVLVTDYSSVMFDFAVTGKPVLLFTYDLEHYRDSVRGFYFDLEAEAPGPLLSRTGELIDALRELDSVVSSYAGAYDRFRARFCHLDDGRASARVVDAVFGG